MSFLRLCTFLAAGLVAVPAFATEIQEVTSPGGIKAWLVEDHTIPFTALNLAFRGGASLDAPGQRGAHGHGGNLPCPAHQVALPDAGGIAHDGHAHALFFQVKHNAAHAVGELHQLASHGLLQAENARDAIAHTEHRAAFEHLGGAVKVFNLPLEDGGYFCGFELHGHGTTLLQPAVNRRRSRRNRPATL